MTPDSFFSLGLKIYRDIEELAIEGVNPPMVREVETLIADGLPEQTKERLQTLSYFYEAFYGEIRELGLSSRSMRYQLAAGRIDEAGIERFDKVIFAGFFALTRAEKMLFHKLLSRSNTVFVFQDGTGLKEKLKDMVSPMSEDGATGPMCTLRQSRDRPGACSGKIIETRLEAGGP
jgi:hypothetical protein